MISAVYPSEICNAQNVQKITSFCSIPFAANKKEVDVFVKSHNVFNEYGLKLQKCETKDDLKDFNKTVEDEFKITFFDKPVRRALFLKADLQNIKRSQYLIKNEKDEITGAFHLYENMHDKNNYKQLYVAEMCIPEKFQKTKTSYGTLKTIFGFIKDKSKDFDCLVLDVDSKNKSLVRMYKKLGFYVKDCKWGYYSMICAVNPEVKDKIPELDVSKFKLIKPHIF